MFRCAVIASLALAARGDATTCSGDSCGNDELGMLQHVGERRAIAEQEVGGVTALCAGKDIRVVTDMGFDDWGAFSILQAAGCMPTHALATKGMMTTAFAANFSRLLQSWSFTTKVHMGSMDCYKSKECINTSFIEKEWGYRSKIRDAYASAKGATISPDAPANLYPASDFWRCQKGQKFTLLAISPLSDVAIELSGNKAARNCVQEIVMMGGFLATSNQGKQVLDGQDMSTQGGLMDGTKTVATPPGNTELNVASDIKAAQYVLSGKISVRMMPLEVASIDRIGKQTLKDGYTADLQISHTTYEVAKLCKTAPGSTMLERMACIHVSGGETATLDMDAIAVTYAWTGDAHFEFKNGRVKVKNCAKTEVCRFYNCHDRNCHRAHMASQFDAVGWFEDLSKLIA